jgi:hypothetical protein
MAFDHQAAIDALYVKLAELNDKTNHSAAGRSFDYDSKAARIMRQIDWHKAKMLDDDGPFEFETVVYP